MTDLQLVQFMLQAANSLVRSANLVLDGKFPDLAFDHYDNALQTIDYVEEALEREFWESAEPLLCECGCCGALDFPDGVY